MMMIKTGVLGRGGLLSCSSEHMAVQINFSPLCFLVKARQPPPGERSQQAPLQHNLWFTGFQFDQPSM